jgi:hypothetical protein
MKFEPNYLFYYMLYTWQTNKDKLDILSANEQYPNGQKRPCCFVNIGGTRSSKTYDEIHLIYKYLTDNPNKHKYVAVYRETLVKCRDTTLKDFKECFQAMGLTRDKDYTLTGDMNGRPVMNVAGNIIEFKGYPDDGKEAGRADVTFINEILESDYKEIVDNIIQRTTSLVIFDANPAKTDHWVFHLDKIFNVFYTNTTYLDNNHLVEGLQGMYESWCPWDLRDSHIEIVDPIKSYDEHGKLKTIYGGFKLRVWDKPKCPEHTEWNDSYRRPNFNNLQRGTVNEFKWLVYGEGVRAARAGAIFSDAEWVQEFNETGYDEVVLSMDFGYTKDPTILGRTGRDGMELTYQVLVDEATETPEITFYAIKPHLETEMLRRKKEGIKHWDELFIVCESQDNYMGTNWVRALNDLAHKVGLNWNFFKVSKSSIAARVDLVKKFRLKLVEHKRLRLEQQNYIYKEGTNQPDPASKFCDCFDALGYGVSNYFSNVN